MANEVIVSIRVLNGQQIPLQGYPVMLINPNTDANPFGQQGPEPATVVWSGTSDGSGYTRFSGVQAGIYDIETVTPSGQSIYSYGYIVKNSYVVNDPVNQFGGGESRFAVRSGEHIDGVGYGILARAFNNQQGTMHSQPYTWTRDPIQTGAQLTGTQPLIFMNSTGLATYQDPMAGTLFTVTSDNESKVAGLSYYHDNQDLYNFQKMDMVIT